MKTLIKHHVIIAIILSLFVKNCNNDDDSSTVTNDPALIGSWELKEVRGGNSERVDEAPSDEDPVVFSLLGEEFSGRTDANNFSGVYGADGSTLTIFTFDTTQENDTAWGNQFYFALSQGFNANTGVYNYDYTVTSETLLIEHTTNTFLYFEKLN